MAVAGQFKGWYFAAYAMYPYGTRGGRGHLTLCRRGGEGRGVLHLLPTVWPHIAPFLPLSLQNSPPPLTTFLPHSLWISPPTLGSQHPFP